MQLNKHDAQTEMKMNMTPMIDVVFLLIIFFMIITDLTQQELEELKLPVAEEAVPDEPDPKKIRPVVNILPDGRMVVKREVKFDPEAGDTTELERYLTNQASWMKSQGDVAPLNEETGTGPMIPDNPLLIRSDQNAPFRFIQKLMAICGKEGIRIWKLELGVAEDPEKKREREEEE